VSPRTVPAVPLDDPATWRRVLARLHPDAGGSHELFLFGTALREAVCGDGLGEPPEEDLSRARQKPRHAEPPGAGEDSRRVPFPGYLSHGEVVDAALRTAEYVGEPYASLLDLLADCWSRPEVFGDEEHRGASYRRLAAIGHRVGMSKRERSRWYEVARRVPLNDRCASHILRLLGGR
jgi:hypothetical protein